MIEFILCGAVGVCVWYLGKYLMDLVATYYKPTTSLPSVEKFLSMPCPKGVKAPIYELCQRMVNDVNFFQVHPDAYSPKRPCGSRTLPWVDSYGIRYEVGIIKKDPLTEQELRSIWQITIPGGNDENIDLSIEEARYFNLAFSLRQGILDKKMDERIAAEEQERKNNEQQLRDTVTKIYLQPPPEVLPNDQTN